MPAKHDEQRIVIATPEGQQAALRAILDLDASSPWEVTIAPHKGKQRGVSANRLYWAWLDQMAKHFSKRAGPFTRDDMHDLMRHQHLGYTDARTIGRTEIPAMLRSTASLSVAEFCEYMTRIDAWALDQGVYLVTPAASQYAEYKKARQ